MPFPYGTNWIRETRMSLAADFLHQVVPKSMTERLLIRAVCASVVVKEMQYKPIRISAKAKEMQYKPIRISAKAKGQIPFQIGASVLSPRSVNFMAPGGWLTIFYDRRFDDPATPH